MSSVSPIGGSGGSSGIDSAQFARGNPAKQFDKDLTKFLESKGVSSDEQANIKEDLKKSLSESVQAGGLPDPSKISNSIKTVLDKHGVDGDEFTKSLPKPPGGRPGGAGGPPPGGPPPGGPPPRSSDVSGTGKAQGNSQQDYFQNLLDQLEESSKKQREEASQKTDKSASTQKSTTTNSNLNRNGGYFDVQA